MSSIQNNAEPCLCLTHHVGFANIQEAQALEDAANGIESLPGAHVGFRRWLTAMYCHTGAHIVAAPMAHYLALNGSRFRYSHANTYFPVYGLENYIHGNKTIMQYKQIGSTKLPVHRCMNYIYRPKHMEKMSTYEFFSKVFEIRLSKRQKKEKNPGMRYSYEHPGHKVFAPRYYDKDKERIPYFSWTYLPTTCDFQTSLHSPVNTEDIDFTKKEEYCKRFLFLFVPFRKKEDLLKDGSYTRRFQEVSSKINPDMIEIAENIQTIHNSLSSPMVVNIITSTTTMEDPEDSKNEQGEAGVDIDDILLRIGTALASTTIPTLTEEPVEICPVKKGKVKISPGEFDTFGELTEAFDIKGEGHGNTDENKKGPCYGEKFSVNTSRLNRLVLQTFLSRKEMDAKQGIPMESTTDNRTTGLREQWIVDATGTWQSIIAWGKVNGLDEDQQTAFEILVATFVLSFHEGRITDEADNEDLANQFNCLCKLTRKETNDLNPLRLFITGPAGAGKCKFHVWAT